MLSGKGGGVVEVCAGVEQLVSPCGLHESFVLYRGETHFLIMLPYFCVRVRSTDEAYVNDFAPMFIAVVCGMIFIHIYVLH